jgi:purine-binding chemotaxis protein CheW
MTRNSEGIDASRRPRTGEPRASTRHAQHAGGFDKHPEEEKEQRTMAENTGRTVTQDEPLDDDEEEDSQKDKFLTFRLGKEDYGIEISHVIEIVGIQQITAVPDMPDFLKGVINLRGRVIPVMDVRVRFQMGPRDYDDRTCVVVVNLGETAVGLIVDTVNEVLSIPAGEVSPPPKVRQGEGSRFVRGLGKVGEAVKILLDLNKLLNDSELEAASAVA